MAQFAQKRLALEQPVKVVKVLSPSLNKKLLADTTVRELNDQYHISMFGPDACDLGTPMVYVIFEDEINGDLFDPEVMTAPQFESGYGPIPVEVSADEVK